MYFIVMYLCERGQICVAGDVVMMYLLGFHTQITSVRCGLVGWGGLIVCPMIVRFVGLGAI